MSQVVEIGSLVVHIATDVLNYFQITILVVCHSIRSGTVAAAEKASTLIIHVDVYEAMFDFFGIDMIESSRWCIVRVAGVRSIICIRVQEKVLSEREEVRQLRVKKNKNAIYTYPFWSTAGLQVGIPPPINFLYISLLTRSGYISLRGLGFASPK